MALDQSDSSKLNYKAKIDWYKERIASLSQGFSNPSVSKEDIDPDQYLSNLKDLRKKADKLSKRIDDSCAGLRIPVDRKLEVISTTNPQENVPAREKQLLGKP